MHMVALVAIEGDDIDEAVRDAMAPFVESWDDDTDEGRGWWDWWVIGGRWTGWLDGYDPTRDADNIESCDLCLGFGRRPDADRFGSDWIKWSGGCNGCKGKGVRAKWPTRWKRHAGDIITPADWLALESDDKYPYTVVPLLTDPHDALHRETWDGSEFITTPDWESVVTGVITQLADVPGVRLVTVDYHS